MFQYSSSSSSVPAFQLPTVFQHSLLLLSLLWEAATIMVSSLKGGAFVGLWILNVAAASWISPHFHSCFPHSSRRFAPHRRQTIREGPLFLSFFASQENKKQPDANEDSVSSNGAGRVVRLAAREYHPEHSKPSSRSYTTQKVEQESVWIDKEGVKGDYNHFRTVALDKTPDRAVSVLTTDAMALLRSYKFKVVDGDLGENILVSGVDCRFFVPGKSYCFVSSENQKPDDESSDVVIEITEAVVPCANLCKLPCINDESKSRQQRLRTCQEMLAVLDKEPGLRGWYAKVVKGGKVGKYSSIKMYEK
jgi:MOSC domain-containing protein YiiM